MLTRSDVQSLAKKPGSKELYRSEWADCVKRCVALDTGTHSCQKKENQARRAFCLTEAKTYFEKASFQDAIPTQIRTYFIRRQILT
eukprot:4368124-Amphidinium_carterae.1